MTGGGGNMPPMQPSSNGGEFLLSLLQRSNHQSQPAPSLQRSFNQQQQPQFPIPIPIAPPQQQTVALDPAVAAVGPSMAFASPIRQPNGGWSDVLSPPNHWHQNLSPSNFLPGLIGFPQQNQNQWQSSNFQGSSDDVQRLGLLQQHKLQFGSFGTDVNIQASAESLLNLNLKLKELEIASGIRNLNGLERNDPFNSQVNSNLRSFDLHEQGRQPLNGVNYNLQKETRIPPPPGFSNKLRGGDNWDSVSRRRELEPNAGDLNKRHPLFNSENERLGYVTDSSRDSGLTRQLDHPVPPAGSNLHSVLGLDVEASLLTLDSQVVEDRKDDYEGDYEGGELDDVGEELVESLLLETESDGKIDKKLQRYLRDKEYRSDSRGQHTLSQRMRMIKRQMECRRDIDRFNVPFLEIYESLIPPEEEKQKQKQLLMLLEKLVNKEWPEARLYLYGSCANSFGVLKSDIDVCLAIQDPDINKADVLLKLADILQSDNLQNVQALTRARVPIVKLMDPVTGISCDICINNVLAVVNSKLLWDYAQIDVRLRQLAFIVKHWAKSRGVNATYQGTLSSYAYVLMCIHFLQQRRPAILPCLQEMDVSYSVTVDDIKCAYFDQVEKLRGFGSRNKETISQLVWGFFNYWAYRHDYANDVISVRRGIIISKREKDWTRRIGNDRHLICIEDPFETSHDLGRVVDKYSIKVLREEFERAANIMQHDPNPCVTLFEPYVPS